MKSGHNRCMRSTRSKCNRKSKQKSHRPLDQRTRIRFWPARDRPHALQTTIRQPQYPHCATFYRKTPWWVETNEFRSKWFDSFSDLILSVCLKVSINTSSAQQRHHFNQNVQTQGVKQSSNQQPCIIVANRPWPAGSTASKAVPASLLHSNAAIYLPSSQSFAAIANATSSSGGGGSSGSQGVSLLSASQSQKSITNDTIIIP